MTNTTKTTIFGGIAAVGMAVVTYLQIGFDPSNPTWWCGMVSAAALGLKSYYTAGTPK